MEALAGRYPNDDEAQIDYALTLNVAASPGDKTYANQLKGAAILEPIVKRQPQHPGVAHYLIHLYDYPPIAEKGLDAAKRYAEIAPAAPHAQHMPSHIFTRVGYWKESIASNARLGARGEGGQGAATTSCTARTTWSMPICSSARTRRRVPSSTRWLRSRASIRDAAGRAISRSPRRRRATWSSAAIGRAPRSSQVRPSSSRMSMAMTHFARALGAARSGKPEAAKADIAKLAELRDKLREAKDAYWSEQVDIQWQVASAWVLYAEGKHDDALKAMSAAADAEDKTEKSPVTPGPLAPARELYGAMLLERGMAKEALAAFEATLKKEPHRLGASIGAAKAAEKSGDAAKARQHYAAAVALAENADPVRAESRGGAGVRGKDTLTSRGSERASPARAGEGEAHVQDRDRAAREQ